MKNYHDILFPYAYNILGSSEDSKDIIQDILVKYLSIQKEHIDNEIGYLIKSVINHSINVKKKKKLAIGKKLWLPEPISTENADTNINKVEILSYSMLVLLERLTAKERGVFILKEAFNYSHKEISETIGITVDNSRQLLSRSKIKLNNPRIINKTPNQSDNDRIEHYINVIRNNDIAALEKLLSKDILVAADGGKSVKVVRELTEGVSNTSKLLLYVYKAFLSGLEIKMTYMNHQPAILYFKNGALFNCQVFEWDAIQIKGIYTIVDPEKLKSLQN